MKKDELRSVFYGNTKSLKGFFHQWVVLGDQVFGLVEDMNGNVAKYAIGHIKFAD